MSLTLLKSALFQGKEGYKVILKERLNMTNHFQNQKR
jgi:hypothetical protein